VCERGPELPQLHGWGEGEAEAQSEDSGQEEAGEEYSAVFLSFLCNGIGQGGGGGERRVL
jgi:hypothetical protein